MTKQKPDLIIILLNIEIIPKKDSMIQSSEKITKKNKEN